ncbi:MAG: GNAT family N-acetyltransferase [Bacteroidales bacterium]|nr:GNAT family N-acetyltransferase [Bacteroidales bacterium]MDD2205143.1 GNAT family N-acetyltransferase [Bacteroidales bacterium]MDD3914886.1 GNAT family N-acetyltransferase [Bacteroidales bacterium]MDD4634671.1 GNAT family N-acetyltransferase [Bacteroidales bacterium]
MNRHSVNTLTTVRLEIISLTPELLRCWVEDMEALETQLNCQYKADPMQGFFREIVKGQLAITEKDPDNYLWHTFRLIIRKSDRAVIGSADFKDVPNINGEVEIGYGIGKEFEHQGYMTEAAEAMCRWALSQPDVKSVIAETYLDGYASQRILQRLGFVEYSRDETVWWRLSRPQTN